MKQRDEHDSPLTHRPVAVAPTFNNDSSVIEVLDGLVGEGVDVIVVDDGSTDTTGRRLAEWASRHGDRVRVLTHAQNCGKGAALRTGFTAAAEGGYTHAATIDTDGQHLPADVPKLLAVSRGQPDALVLGTRARAIAGCPGRSRFGRLCSSMGVFLATGVRLSDTQCGLRVYPLRLFDDVHCRAGGYGLESEVIIRAAWAGFPVVETPIRCRYFVDQRRVSHYRPWLDSIRVVFLQFRLALTRMLPWHRVKRRGDAAGERDARPLPWWRRLWRWIDPVRAWRQVRSDEVGRLSFAAGVSLGAFIANLPLWGLQTLLGLYAARRLNLHPVSVVLGTNLSMPPIGPALIIVAIGLGHLMLHGALPDWPVITFSFAGFVELSAQFILEWLVGSLVVGLACAALAFVSVLGLLRLVPAPAVDPVACEPTLPRGG